MGKCKYCQEDAGFFRSVHSECQEKHNSGRAKLVSLLVNAFKQRTDFYLIDSQIKQLLNDSFIAESSASQLYVEALDLAVDAYLDDGLIDQDEEKVIARFQQYTALPQQILNTNQSLEKVVQSKILVAISNGRTIPKVSITGSIPFLLQKSEELIWMFRDIQYYQQKTMREYRGRSHGMSFKVMKGVYYRVGQSRAKPIETTNTVFVDSGCVGITNKHIYFSSPTKSFKIPYTKIIDLQPFADGISLQKDGTSSQPMFLKGVNSWFVCNLLNEITNL